MKITKENYFSIIGEIGMQNLSENMKKGYELVNRATRGGEDWKSYSMFQKAFDAHFEALGLLYDKLKGKSSAPETHKKEIKPYPLPKHSPAKPKTEREHKHQPKHSHLHKKEHKKPHPEFEKPKVKGRGVELISPEVSFIKRFVSMHNKTKSLDQVGSFIRSLQKAIVERRIRKTSKYAKVIMEIQTKLLDRFRKGKENIQFNFDAKDLNRYYKMAGAEIVMPSIRFIKAFVSLKGREITRHKAKNLLDRIKKAISKKTLNNQDRYFKEIRTIINSLEEFLNQNVRKTLALKETQLNGLEGALKNCGCHALNGTELSFKKKEDTAVEDGVMTVEEARKQQFRPVPLAEPWLGLIGKMCLPTHFLVYGLGGSGKTSFVLLFTQYLASLGYKILYAAREQYNTPTMTELLNRLNIVVGENLKIVKNLDVLDPRNFDFVVLDSKDEMDINLPMFKEIKAKYPDQSFIMISQANKDGSFTGTGKWRNAVDVMVYADKGVIKTGLDKNRWGGSAEMRIV